ncbi:hypothetical protein BH20ACI2_BH20ACI2_02720 [soil metagenome]
MNEKTWQKAKELFHEARSLPADQRGMFLDEHCLNDQTLREQVDELLGFYDSEFLESPPLMNAAKLLENDNFAPGRVIGRYHIRELIGTGGMGQVFLADDSELNRPVAFKVLHEEVAGDKERVRRFIQEARAASALNHPNILTIYEIGTFETARFIVSEYVDGETLRDRMRSGLTPAESVEITCQIAAALQAAHAAGIVHRDIKPENIMLREDGLVKVLDFGLAKLSEADDQPIGPAAPAISRFQTSPGLVMGTVAYMSPEQARGQAVDSRTDLWSLGVVFHEMLTGESPFEGESVTELVSSILKNAAVTVSADKLPPELRPICTKSLAKNKEARYQSAKDLIQDLQGEKKKMEYAILPDRFIIVSPTDDNQKTQLIRRRPTLSAEYIVTSVKRHKFAALVSAALIVASGIGFSVYKFNGATPPNSIESLSAIGASTTERDDLKSTKLPISLTDGNVVISPDGKYVAYGSDKGLKLLEVETWKETEIIPATNVWDLTFSYDGKYIYYAYGGYNTEGFKRVSIQGGTPEKVEIKPAAFSPDGSMMVFTREFPAERGGEVAVANADGTNERTLAKSTKESWIGCDAFSPDGKTLACVVHSKEESGAFFTVMGLNVSDGKQRPISEKRWTRIYGAVWLPNGNLIISAQETPSSLSQLWSIPPGGEPRAITNSPADLRWMTATRNGDTLLTSQMTNSRDLLILPNNDVSKATRLGMSSEVNGRSTWTPDGRIVLSSNASGNPDIWIINADGSGRRRLTQDPASDAQPAVSLDGRYIAFTSKRVDGVVHIFRMDIDGSNIKQLTTGQGERLASFSRDGKWVYFVDEGKEDAVRFIRKVSVSGGEAMLVATAPDGWSFTGIDVNRADGRLVYGLEQFPDHKFKLGIISAQGGQAIVIDLPAKMIARRPIWAPDNRSVAVLSIESNVNNPRDIWSIPVDGKAKPRQLTDFGKPQTPNFSWSHGGKQLLVNRAVATWTPILIRNAGN